MNWIEKMIAEQCPQGVKREKLGKVCEIRGRIGFRGYTRKDQVEKGNGALSLSPGNIDNQKMIYDKGTFITWAKYEESPEIKTENEDIIFCKTASVGKVAIVKNLPCKATINPQLVVLKNISPNTSFLYYVLSANSIQNEVKKNQGIGSVPNISQSILSNLEIPLPPLSIQEEIVNVLDKFTELIEKTDKEIELRQKQYEYYREKLLTFEEGEAEWKKLGEVAKMYDGTHQTPKYTDSGIKFVSVENIGDIYSSNKYISIEDYQTQYRYKPQINDVLMTRIGSIGKCAVIEKNEPLAYYVSLALIRPDLKQVSSKYIRYILESNIGVKELWKRTLVHAVPLKINLSSIPQITIPVPSLSRQQDIVYKLDKFETMISKLKEERELRQKQYEYYREKLLTF